MYISFKSCFVIKILAFERVEGNKMRNWKSKHEETEDSAYGFALNIVVFLIFSLASLLAIHVFSAKEPAIRVYVPANSAIALSEKASIGEEKK